MLALTTEFEHKQVQKYLTKSIESYLTILLMTTFFAAIYPRCWSLHTRRSGARWNALLSWKRETL